MRRFLLVVALLGVASVGARAADEFGIDNEKAVLLKGRVVDVVCTLKGDCPPDCGGGRRQLGLLEADGKLRMAAKSNTFFAGAVRDLSPYCGKTIEVDGLLIENPAATLLMPQKIRESADKPWTETTAFEKEWSARNGKAPEWYRADPLVKDIVGADGVLGIKGLAPK